MEEKHRVLIMDDSDLTLAAATSVLEREGFEVKTATTLGAFNAILNRWAPHVVLTDVQMPELAGTELCAWIKSRVQTADVPILLYSGLPDDELAELARQSGADGFVTKSRGMKHVVRELRAFCQGVVF